MAVAAKWYGNALLRALSKNIDIPNDNIKVALFTSAHTPDQGAHVYFDVSCVTNQVVNGNGYTTGGALLGTKQLTYTAGTRVIMFDAADTTWSSSTITARWAIIYDDTPASNKPLLCFVDFGADVASTNGNFTIQWDAAGIATVTVAA